MYVAQSLPGQHGRSGQSPGLGRGPLMKVIQVQRPDRMGAAGTCRWRLGGCQWPVFPLPALGPGLALGRRAGSPATRTSDSCLTRPGTWLPLPSGLSRAGRIQQVVRQALGAVSESQRLKVETLLSRTRADRQAPHRPSADPGGEAGLAVGKWPLQASTLSSIAQIAGSGQPPTGTGGCRTGVHQEVPLPCT